MCFESESFLIQAALSLPRALLKRGSRRRQRPLAIIKGRLGRGPHRLRLRRRRTPSAGSRPRGPISCSCSTTPSSPETNSPSWSSNSPVCQASAPAACPAPDPVGLSGGLPGLPAVVGVEGPAQACPGLPLRRRARVRPLRRRARSAAPRRAWPGRSGGVPGSAWRRPGSAARRRARVRPLRRLVRVVRSRPLHRAGPSQGGQACRRPSRHLDRPLAVLKRRLRRFPASPAAAPHRP